MEGKSLPECQRHCYLLEKTISRPTGLLKNAALFQKMENLEEQLKKSARELERQNSEIEESRTQEEKNEKLEEATRTEEVLDRLEQELGVSSEQIMGIYDSLTPESARQELLSEGIEGAEDPARAAREIKQRNYGASKLARVAACLLFLFASGKAVRFESSAFAQ